MKMSFATGLFSLDPFLVGLLISTGIAEMLRIRGGKIVPSVKFGTGAEIQIIVRLCMQHSVNRGLARYINRRRRQAVIHIRIVRGVNPCM